MHCCVLSHFGAGVSLPGSVADMGEEDSQYRSGDTLGGDTVLSCEVL